MIDGTFLAHEYSLSIGDRTFSGKCAGVTKDTKFDGLGDSKEDKGIALGIIATCLFAHKFEGGDQGPGYQKYYVSMDGGESWLYQPRKFRMDGDRVVVIVKLTGEDVPEAESGTMILDGDTLSVSKKNSAIASTMVFKKVQV
jgi:hypothetical protein